MYEQAGSQYKKNSTSAAKLAKYLAAEASGTEGLIEHTKAMHAMASDVADGLKKIKNFIGSMSGTIRRCETVAK